MTVLSIRKPTPEDPLHFLISLELSSGWIWVSGEFDRVGAHHFDDAVAALARTTHPTWTLDLAGVSFCDVEGLRSLVRAQAEAVRRGSRLRLGGASPFLRRLLTLVDLQEHIVDAKHTAAHGAPMNPLAELPTWRRPPDRNGVGRLRRDRSVG